MSWETQLSDRLWRAGIWHTDKASQKGVSGKRSGAKGSGCEVLWHLVCASRALGVLTGSADHDVDRGHDQFPH